MCLQGLAFLEITRVSLLQRNVQAVVAVCEYGTSLFLLFILRIANADLVASDGWMVGWLDG